MVKRLTLADVVEGLGGGRHAALGMPVTPVIDSREAGPGAVFFAFRGENVDGHAFVEDAFSRGAAAAVVERPLPLGLPTLDTTADSAPENLGAPLIIQTPNVLQALQNAACFWRRQLQPRVIGITGSIGKTTTKEVAARVLEQRYRVRHSAGSYNNEIGLPLTLLKLTDADQYLVLEMGMYVQGDIQFLAELAQPHVGVITNVQPVHAERAGSIDNIALGKRELVESLPPAPEGIAILNYDDRRVRAMAEHTAARVVYYGSSPEAHLWADEVESLGLEGIRLHLHYGKDAVYVKVPLLGRHSVHTVLRAAAVGLVEGLDWQNIVEGLHAPGTQLRLVAVPGVNGSLFLDDTYNASPASTLAALNLLKDLDGRKIAVLGDMLELGDYEEAGHLKVGCRAASVVAKLVTVGARAQHIARGAELCGLERGDIYSTPDGPAAEAVLRELLTPGDVILVKGSRALRMECIVAHLTEDRS